MSINTSSSSFYIRVVNKVIFVIIVFDNNIFLIVVFNNNFNHVIFNEFDNNTQRRQDKSKIQKKKMKIKKIKNLKRCIKVNKTSNNLLKVG